MKNQWVALSCAPLLTTAAAAEIDIYGKANVSARRTERGDASYSELHSKGSSLGVSGEQDLGNGLIAVYRAEAEYEIDDGEKDGHTLKARENYIGIKGRAGTVLAGRMDTPLKKGRSKIDIHGYMAGDIKHVITNSDDRTDNSFQYITPDTLGPFTVEVGYIMNEEDGADDGLSLSGSVEFDSVLVGAAVERDVEAETVNVLRVIAEWRVGRFTLSGLWEDQDPGDTALNTGDGWLVSGLIKLNPVWYFGAHYGRSDIVADHGETYGAKLNRILNDNAHISIFYISEESDDPGLDDTYAGFGMEFEF